MSKFEQVVSAVMTANGQVADDHGGSGAARIDTVVELRNGGIGGFNSLSTYSCVNEVYIVDGQVRLSTMSLNCPHFTGKGDLSIQRMQDDERVAALRKAI